MQPNRRYAQKHGGAEGPKTPEQKPRCTPPVGPGTPRGETHSPPAAHPMARSPAQATPAEHPATPLAAPRADG
eukprot:4963998-Prymnesium_polylepis.1